MTVVSLAVIYVVWGANFLFIDVAVRDLSPAMMMGVRFSVAGLLLLALSRRLGSRSIDRPRAWIESLRTAVFLFAGGSGLLAWGLVYLDSGVGAILLATIPAWLVIIELISTRSRLSLRTSAGLIAGLVGVALVVQPMFPARASSESCLSWPQRSAGRGEVMGPERHRHPTCWRRPPCK